MKKRFFQIIIIIFGVGFIVKLRGDLLRLLRATQRIKVEEERILKLEEKRRELSQKYQYYQTPEFIEEEARNKLNMARPGETIVIIPPNLNEIINHSKSQVNSPLPNWRQWWNLFF